MQLNNEEGEVGKRSVIIWPFPQFHFPLLSLYSVVQPSCSSLFAPVAPSAFPSAIKISQGVLEPPPGHCHSALGLPPLKHILQHAVMNESVSQLSMNTLGSGLCLALSCTPRA